MEGREIRFKAFDGSIMSANSKTIQELAESGISSRDASKLIWLQFTGANDKNGKGIYEGDICQIHYYHTSEIPSPIGIVKYIENHSGFSIVAVKNIDGKALTGTYSLNFRSGGNFGDSPAVEVIGNIYENPNLLKTNSADEPT